MTFLGLGIPWVAMDGGRSCQRPIAVAGPGPPAVLSLLAQIHIPVLCFAVWVSCLIAKWRVQASARTVWLRAVRRGCVTALSTHAPFECPEDRTRATQARTGVFWSRTAWECIVPP